MKLLSQLLFVCLWSGFKFVVGFGMSIACGFNVFIAWAATVGGGMLGVVFYLYVWDFILKFRNKHQTTKHKIVPFSKWKRLLVKIIKEYELYGIAFLTPVLLSMPVGTLLAAAIEKNKWRIKLFMFAALNFWFIILYAFKLFFNIDFQ